MNWFLHGGKIRTIVLQTGVYHALRDSATWAAQHMNLFTTAEVVWLKRKKKREERAVADGFLWVLLWYYLIRIAAGALFTHKAWGAVSGWFVRPKGAGYVVISETQETRHSFHEVLCQQGVSLLWVPQAGGVRCRWEGGKKWKRGEDGRRRGGGKGGVLANLLPAPITSVSGAWQPGRWV